MERRAALVHNSSRGRRDSEGSLPGSVDRGGLLLKHEQLETGATTGPNEDYLRGTTETHAASRASHSVYGAFIKLHPSEDAIYLAITKAQSEVEVTDGELAVFIDAIYGEARDNKWPKGFY